jgi:hypothetical protein
MSASEYLSSNSRPSYQDLGFFEGTYDHQATESDQNINHAYLLGSVADTISYGFGGKNKDAIPRLPYFTRYVNQTHFISGSAWILDGGSLLITDPHNTICDVVPDAYSVRFSRVGKSLLTRTFQKVNLNVHVLRGDFVEEAEKLTEIDQEGSFWKGADRPLYPEKAAIEWAEVASVGKRYENAILAQSVEHYSGRILLGATLMHHQSGITPVENEMIARSTFDVAYSWHYLKKY